MLYTYNTIKILMQVFILRHPPWSNDKKCEFTVIIPGFRNSGISVDMPILNLFVKDASLLHAEI